MSITASSRRRILMGARPLTVTRTMGPSGSGDSGATRRGTVFQLSKRLYHDESFGYRVPRKFEFPDYTPAQLENRHVNAPLLRYVDSMRTHGHRAARIDPLDLIHREEVPALDPKRYGLEEDGKKYNVDGILWTRPVSGGTYVNGEEWWTLSEIRQRLREVYVGRIAYEFMHSPSKTERLWFSHALESKSSHSRAMSDDKKQRIHELLAKSEVLDNFLQLKFPNLKRYGLEGGESMLPALDALFSSAALGGIENIILAMPHRGRLNLLACLLQYPPSSIFHKIRGGAELRLPEDLAAQIDMDDLSGDVLSHLVANPTLEYGEGKKVKVSLLPNPSHLEAVNPVALGKTRAKQYSLLKTTPRDCELGDKVMCVQLHGDASFVGQGVVMEGLGLSNLPHFTSGGSVHLVVDNNIGYTTPASNARSSLYCSDVGKMINAPVLHVNGDHPEDVVRAIEIACRYREYFRKDVIVDLLVYRRWHNELDLPSITSPLMYEHISSRRSVPELYEQKLLSDQTLTPTSISTVRTSYKSHLESELQTLNNASASPATGSASRSYTPPEVKMEGQWKGMVWPGDLKNSVRDPITGIDESNGEMLKEVGRGSVWVPEGFEIHPKLQRHVKSRLQSLESGKGVDFATAEALAFGTLMLEGVDVRISGQDVGRGTFSHRHAMLVDQKTEKVVVPLNEEMERRAAQAGKEQAFGRMELANSSLSEMAVLGFEYGASWERPNLLPIWEAQFGDFFNGAQVIIDTFISSAETKWFKQSAIVLALPHGLDGAGPEHSSSRIERMLQLTNDRFSVEDFTSLPPMNVNMHVAFPTTPAQYFHLLRRQMKRNYRKPLVLATPKGLLRLSAASSTLAELGRDTSFRPVISDPLVPPSANVERVVLLTGKLYYELVKERQARGLDRKVAFVRVEELAPFPFGEVYDALSAYQRAATSGLEWVWAQEEPRNQGAYGHVKERLDGVVKAVLEQHGGDAEVRYVTRKESAVPAPGIGSLYGTQQKRVLEGVFMGL